ncbi:hypothetical protein [Flavobacterium sp. PL002]|uniref:XAC2610-related protein n=1 Tax=Flavobacterium sp. PL002 TaxID=1897058 RepID=UPI001787B8E7|nr:hypothetical protein [Flavobacterium sp. PL002]MBE0393765.1 hypothetical protein [Flavobacterium sp. PL002]
MKKKIICILILMIVSCKENNKIDIEKNIEEGYALDFKGHTFFKVTETDSGKVLYKPCGANIEKYIIYDDSIFHNLGQEHYMFKISSKETLKNQINIKLIYKNNLEVPQTADSLVKITPLDKTHKYLKINKDIFIDSVFANTLPIINELPCDEDCYDCPKQETIKEECSLNNLSKKLNFKLLTEYDKLNDDDAKKWKANIIIMLKDNNSVIDNIEFIPNSWAFFSNIQCDIISVSDYNFDGLEDFTIMLDVGGNSGPIFSYFFQNKNNKFIKDQTFKFQDGSLPNKIDAENKTLTFGSIIFQLKDNNWQQIN